MYFISIWTILGASEEGRSQVQGINEGRQSRMVSLSVGKEIKPTKGAGVEFSRQDPV